MSKRKKASRDDRRRQPIEINLLADQHDGNVLARARRGCSLPLLGGVLIAILLNALPRLLT
jgi:hypothetical protein